MELLGVISEPLKVELAFDSWPFIASLPLMKRALLTFKILE